MIQLYQYKWKPITFRLNALNNGRLGLGCGWVAAPESRDIIQDGGSCGCGFVGVIGEKRF